MESDRRQSSNAFRATVFGADDRTRLIAFVCECGQDGCSRTVALTAEEYARRRPGLILHESHDDDLYYSIRRAS
jgi:hypothetical protein